MIARGTPAFASRVPQRLDATGKQPGCESPCDADVGPGTYTPRPGTGQPFLKPWIAPPQSFHGMSYSFISKTQKTPTPRSVTADVDLAANVPGGVSAHHLQFVQGRMPASQGLTWPKGERKPPHFHVPFRAYPSASGAPRGRSKGLDTIYDLDQTIASPIALHGTLAVNMARTPRRYASTFRSRAPARPPAGGSPRNFYGEASALASREAERGGIKIKEPKRPSSGFARDSGGKMRNVGGPRRVGGLWPEQYGGGSDEWGLRSTRCAWQ